MAKANGVALPRFGFPFALLLYEPRMGSEHVDYVAIVIDRELESEDRFVVGNGREIKPTNELRNTRDTLCVSGVPLRDSMQFLLQSLNDSLFFHLFVV